MNGGKFEFDDGGYYVGEWKKGQAEGYGVCTGPKNLGKFEGLWECGTEVCGIYTWPNGMNYKGEWQEGHRSGLGIEQRFDKKVYLGEWLDGVKHGSGVIQCSRDGKPSFEGTWKNGFQDGYGIEIYKDGGYYAGQWKEGYRHGYGMKGHTDPSNLPAGSLSLRQLLLNTGPSTRRTRPSTVYGMDQVFQNERDHVKHTSESPEMTPLRKSFSSPGKLSSKQPQSTPTSLDPSTAAPKKQRHSVFQMMFPFRKDGDEKKEEVKTEVYKGCWEYDAREGFGICYYGDGSRYVGAWKENKRHGYGLLIFKDGKKSGGKWYNDNLLLMTRRKNLRLPMIRKKINRTVLAAIDAAEKGNNKMKLAISRGLSAKKIAESAKDVAALAERNAQQAMECRKKYTLHPCLQATLTDFSRRNSNVTDLSCQSSTADLSRSGSVSNISDTCSSRSEKSATQKSNHPNVQIPDSKHARTKRSSLLSSFKCNSNDLGLDVIRNLDRHPARESALYAAMDITIGAGAINPYISQMILMNHNDAQSRMKNAIATSKSSVANTMSSNEVFRSALLPIVMDIRDSPDGLCHPEISPPTKGAEVKSGKSFLHPTDYSANATRRRKYGTGVYSSIDSNSSVSSEDARLIQMKGKLLTGEYIDYDYIAVSASMDGQETLVLHTDHPRPKFKSDHTISEKDYVNSSTGLYRTVVGKVPNVLNTVKPTGIVSLDLRRDSVDSGTANDDLVLKEESLKSSQPQLEKYELTSSLQNTDKLACVPITYSPSFEESEKHARRDEEKESTCEKSKTEPSEQLRLTDQKGNVVSIAPRSNRQQVVINQRSRKRDLSTQTSLDDIEGETGQIKCASADNVNRLTNKKFSISTWLTKRLWSNRDSLSSTRSLSSDSGYKQSMSFDDVTQTCNTSKSFPRIPMDEANIKEGGCIGTTVVTIENDKFRRLNSIDAVNKKPTNDMHSPDRHLQSPQESGFDLYRTIEGSPRFPTKDIQLPTFFASPTRDLSPTDDRLSDFESYVILDEPSEVCDTSSETTGDCVTSDSDAFSQPAVTWV